MKNTIEQYKTDCLARWQHLEQEARNKWRQHKAGRMTKAQLHEWLNGLDAMDRRTIKRIYAASGRG